MTDHYSASVREAIHEIVTTQLQENSPPQVRRTSERLIASGYTSEEAFTLVGCALSREMFEVLGSEQGFDEERYIASLERLPASLWD
ncbi:hypothetical protein [Nitrosospira sp. NpAV]|uniref:hypothetical protein n=1 Tax=Nitrosospira sp. NpAV TaxID=58133 RepID=UPI00059FB73A|nr:hypothetical protein [Nitrosospira sp. NpAV]KIO49171.1 hypothetical protein SQ11_07780 [Nitrosospira sp. NpAV]